MHNQANSDNQGRGVTTKAVIIKVSVFQEFAFKLRVLLII